MRIKFIDGLRGPLALFVAISHISGSAFGWFGPRHIFQNANICVDCFFILSGFVLTLTVNERDNFFVYLIRRIERLWPSYIIILLFYFFVCFVCAKQGFWWPGDSYFTPPRIIANLTLTQNFLGPVQDSIIGPSWSISVELFVSSALIIGLRRFGPRMCLAVAASAYVILAVTTGKLLYATIGSVYNDGILRGIAGIGFGMAIAKQFPQRGISAPTSFWQAISIIILAVISIYIYSHGQNSDFLIVVLFSILIALIWNGFAPSAEWLLSTALFVFLGEISYSLYLIHIPIMVLLQPYFSPLGQTLTFEIVSIAAIAAGAAFHFLVERPIRDVTKPLLRRFISSLQPAQESPAFEHQRQVK